MCWKRVYTTVRWTACLLVAIVFFYGNPLSSNGNHKRSEWFGTACCPSNIARLIESLGDYIYAKSDNDLWVNLFVGSNASIDLKNNNVQIEQRTNYPWDGDVQLVVSPQKKSKFSIHIRIPGWAQSQPSPGDTYRFLDNSVKKWTLTLNGQTIPYIVTNGYAVINKAWEKGDIVSLSLPIETKKVIAIDSISEDRNKISLQRGPLMYCFEHPDNDGMVNNIYIPDNIQFSNKK